VVGPILGGWITDNIHWSWIFYLNVPVGILVALLAWVLLKDRETITEKLPIDVIGLILLAFGVTALQIMLDKGSDDAWFQSSFIIVMGVIAFVALSFLVSWELTDKHPVIDLTLFKRRNFTVATLAITLGYMAYFGGIVVFPLWLQNYHGYSATWAGLAMSSLGIMAFIASPIVGRLTDRFDLRILVTAGLLIFAFLSFIKGSFNVDATFAQLFLARLPWGMGSTLFLIPLLTLSLSGLGRDRMASASGLFNFMRLLALSFGTSLSQTLWHRRSNLHDHHLTAGINAFNPAVRHWLHRAHEAGMSQMQALAHLTHSISSQASLLGLNDMYWLAGWTFLGLTVLIWFSRPEGRGRRKAPAA
jgi:DHA2 family multidrug resistance protein